MGTWGVELISNDAAMDFLGSIYGDKTYQPLFDLLHDNDLLSEDYLDSREGMQIVIASKIVLSNINKNFKDWDGVYEEARIFITSTPLNISNDLILKCKKLLELVLSETSELNLLWKENDKYNIWRHEVESMYESFKKLC